MLYVYATSKDSLVMRLKQKELISGVEYYSPDEFKRYNDISTFPDDTPIILFKECPGNKPLPYQTVKLKRKGKRIYVE